MKAKKRNSEEAAIRKLDKGWSDGFPLIPPTEAKVRDMLATTSLQPDDVITVLAPGMGMATAKIVAINASAPVTQ